MANVTGLITVNSKDVLEVDADPSAGGGTVASRGSLAMFDTGSAGRLYIKTGTADTAWSLIDANDQDWHLDGNTEGAEKKFGTTDDFDVPHIRNNVELMRLVSQGLLIGLNASVGGRLQIEASALNADSFREQGPNGGSGAKVVKVTRTLKVQTTDATLTTLADIAVPSDSVALLTLNVTCRQHGGVGGAVGDGAVYVREIHAKNAAGTVTIQKDQTSFTSEDVGGFDLDISASTGNVRAQVMGAVSRNIAWFGHVSLLIAVN